MTQLLLMAANRLSKASGLRHPCLVQTHACNGMLYNILSKCKAPPSLLGDNQTSVEVGHSDSLIEFKPYTQPLKVLGSGFRVVHNGGFVSPG